MLDCLKMAKGKQSITAARTVFNTPVSSHYCTRKIIKVGNKENKTGHLWVPSGGEYSDPDPAKLLNTCLSLKHEHSPQVCVCITKSHEMGWANWKNTGLPMEIL